MKPTVVFIGGSEVGKTSVIQTLWADEAIEYFKDKQGAEVCCVEEMISGRDIMKYNVVELPKIRYTSSDYLCPPRIYIDFIQGADVIVLVIPINDISINSHEQFVYDLLKNSQLKQNVIILVALSKSDIVLTPKAAYRNEIDEHEKIELSAISSITQKVSFIHSIFNKFIEFDRSFNAESIIPCSYALQWNFDVLKYHIWGGVVLGMNDFIYDSSLPTVVIAGKTGCGKTSIINKLWNRSLAVDRAVSCTKFPAVMHIEDYVNEKVVKFNLVDLPGIAESMEANSLYRNFYYKYIDKANVLICVTQADRRAYKQDELFYNELIDKNILRQEQNIILGINQADLLFKSKENLDGVDMNLVSLDNCIVQEKINDLYYGMFESIFKDFNNVTIESIKIFSVLQNWNTNVLKEKINSFIK